MQYQQSGQKSNQLKYKIKIINSVKNHLSSQGILTTSLLI